MRRRTSNHYDQAIIKLSNSPNHRLILSVLCPYCEGENAVTWEGKLKENWNKYPNWPSVHDCEYCEKTFNFSIKKKKVKHWAFIANKEIEMIFWAETQRYIIKGKSENKKGREKKQKKSYWDIIRDLRYIEILKT